LIERNLTLTIVPYAGKATKSSRGKHGEYTSAMCCEDCEGPRVYTESTGPGAGWHVCEQHVARLVEGEEVVVVKRVVTEEQIALMKAGRARKKEEGR
jgi:hypothetical protein